MDQAADRRAPLWTKGPHDGRLLRFLATHCVIGLAAGLVFAGAFLAFDVASLRTVLTATREAGLAIFMFCFALAFLFGSLAMGVGVMTLPRDMTYGQSAARAADQNDAPDP